MSVLLTARCAEGHTWDVFGEELEVGYLVDPDDLECPECEPVRYAERCAPAESLA